MLTVHRAEGAQTAVLPAGYVRQHVELGYATTVYRAQGQTVDTAHAVVTGPSMSREGLYVAMTRGRNANHAYVATEFTPDPDTAHVPTDRWTATQIINAALTRTEADISATETRLREHRTSRPGAAGRVPPTEPEAERSWQASRGGVNQLSAPVSDCIGARENPGHSWSPNGTLGPM